METFVLKNTEDTPRVELNKNNNVFVIEGRSLPENAISFYLPILNWFYDYSNNPLNPTIIDIKLEYFNTASAKQITKLLLCLQELSKKAEVTVRWHYYKEDTDIMSSGIRFGKLININIELVEYE